MPKTPSDSRERAAPSAKAPLEEAPVGLVERLLRFFAPLWGWSFIVWCLTTTCVNGNIIPVFLLFFVRPLFPRLHERFLSNQASWGWGSIADFTQLQGRLRPRITGTCDARSLELLRSGNAMLLSNHVDATDGLALFVLAQRCGRLGSLRFFAKHELLFVPVLGLAAYFLNFIFLARDWARDRRTIERTFQGLWTAERKPSFWMVLFPEGTRITPEKLAAAQEFAAARALPVPRHVLIPRVKGLVASLAHLRPRLDAIVDVTIGYSERDPRSKRVRPSLGDVMLRRGREWPVHVHVRVIPIEDVPTDEDALREWVLELFRDKDAALEELARRGAMPGAEMLRLPPPSARAALAGALSYSLPCFPLLLAAGLAAGHGAALWRGGGAG